MKFSQGIRSFIQPLLINLINLHLSFIGVKFLKYINDYGIMDNWDGSLDNAIQEFSLA